MCGDLSKVGVFASKRILSFFFTRLLSALFFKGFTSGRDVVLFNRGMAIRSLRRGLAFLHNIGRAIPAIMRQGILASANVPMYVVLRVLLREAPYSRITPSRIK